MRQRHVLQDQAGNPDGGAGAAPGAPAGGGGDAPAAGAAAGAAPAVAAPAAGAGSVLAAGAAAPAPASGDPVSGAAPAPAATPHGIPEKYLVKKGEAVDLEASAKKLAEGYQALAKRLGTGELPPATPDEYAPTLPETINLDALKADPEYQGFLKAAHAKGITNAQLGFVIEEYARREQAKAPSPERAFAELQKAWESPAEFQANARHAFKAISTFGEGLTDAEKAALDASPVALRVLARVGAQLSEDVAPILDGSQAAQTWQQRVSELQAHPAYTDRSHPEHNRVVQQVTQLYERRHGSKPVGRLTAAMTK
ncbi:MAG: hypothetical protein ACK51Q_08435 [Betaproteobacteria bacterium]